MQLEFRILGPLEVHSPGAPIGLGGPRQRAVLAILLLNANRVVSIDRLADELYGGEPPATAVTQVQRQVSDLRKLLGPVIETRPPGYLVRAGGDTLDLSCSSGSRRRPAPPSRTARMSVQPRCCARGLRSGGGRHSRTSPMSRSPRRRSRGSRSSGSPPSSSASKPSWRSASTAG